MEIKTITFDQRMSETANAASKRRHKPGLLRNCSFIINKVINCNENYISISCHRTSGQRKPNGACSKVLTNNCKHFGWTSSLNDLVV